MTTPTITGLQPWHAEEHAGETFVTPAQLAAAIAAHEATHHAPPLRRVMPGENITAILASDPFVTLAPGSHSAFVVNGLEDIEVTFEPGSFITGATRAIEIIGGSGTLIDLDVHGNAYGVQFRGDCDWLVGGGKAYGQTKMVRNTQTPTNDDYGASAFAFDDVTGAVTVRGVKVYGNRVDKNIPSYDYGLNEGSAFELFKATGVVIEDCIVYDNQVALETGTNDAAKQCSFTFRGNTVWNGKTDAARVSKGLLLRTAVNSLVEHNVLDGMDDWAMNPSGGGGYGGSVQGLTIRDNVAWTPSALIRLGGPVGTWTKTNNAVAGSMAWGDVPAHGPAEADPFVDRANHNYALKAGSTLRGAAHDGTDIGL